MLISSCEGQKGGAKSAMRGRGGRGGSAGRGRVRGGNNGNNGNSVGTDSFGNGTGRRACVGLCYLRLNIKILNINFWIVMVFLTENYKENHQYQRKKKPEDLVSGFATERNFGHCEQQGENKGPYGIINNLFIPNI